MKIRIKLLILSLFLALSSTAQINDTAILRNYINANIIPNNTRSVTADQVYYSLTGLLNVSNRYKLDSITLKGDSLIYYIAGKRRGQKFNVPGVDSVRLSSDSLYFRRIIGGEIPIKLDYYNKSQSDDRYVRSPAGKIARSWITAWDYCLAADVPNIADPESKYLIVNGAAGDTAFTVTGGTGMSDFAPNFAAVAYSRGANRYFSFFVVRQSGSIYHTDRPLKHNLVNDTIHFMWNSYQGQHMTWYGYKGYADMFYDYQKSLAAKDYKLYSFYPEDNPSVPFVAINGAAQGGFIPSTSIPQLYSITTATINYSQIATTHFLIQQGTVAGRGGEWQVNLGKKSGYLETWVGINRSLPGFARVLFYLDGVLQKVDTVRGAVQKLTYSYSKASTGKIQIVTGDTQNTAIRIGRTVWHQTDLDPSSKVYSGGKIMFVGDSWTQFPIIDGVFFQGFTERFKERYVADGGNPADIINVGRGGMTSVWGRHYLNHWIDLYHPKYIVFEFYINDSNSSSSFGDPAVTTWNFSSTDPYSPGADVDGKTTQAGWLSNLSAMGDTAIAHDAIPIHMMNTPTGSLTQTQGQSQWYSALRPAKQYYDIETIFSSGLYADGSANAPAVNATTGVVDTVVTKQTKGGTAVVGGSYKIVLQALNSSTTKGLIITPNVPYTGSAGKIVSVENNPNGTEVFSIANNGLTNSVVGFSAGTSYAIPPFQISYSGGIVRFAATNSTSVLDYYMGDSSMGVIRMRVPLVLANYSTSLFPTSSQQRVKGGLGYDTDLNKARVTDGFSWSYLATENWVNSNTILNQQAIIQTADLSISGNAAAGKLFSRAGTAGGAMTHYSMMTPAGLRRFTFDLTGFESTGNAGSNFQVNRWDDTDISLGAAWFIRRSDGFTGVGTTTPRYKMDVSSGVMYGDGIGTSIVTKNTNNTASASNETVLNCTTSITQTLPDAAAANYGRIFIVNKDYPGGSPVTISSNNIEGATTYTLTDTVQSVTLISSGVSWRVVGTKIGTPGYRHATATLDQVTTAGNTTTNNITTGSVSTSSAPAYASGGISALGRNNTTGRFETYTPSVPTIDQVSTAGSTTTNSLTVGDLSTSNGTAYSSGGISAVGRNNTTGRLETYTPTISPVSVIYGDGSLSTFPTGVDYLILRPTANNTIELSSTATYVANAGRVAVILNTTNFTYTIAGTTVSSKYVYVAWYANNTPSFINL